MKNKGIARSARTTAKNIHISQGGRDLTAQTGLIPLVEFFYKEGIVSKTGQTVDHQLFLKKPVKEWGETQSKYSIAGFRRNLKKPRFGFLMRFTSI